MKQTDGKRVCVTFLMPDNAADQHIHIDVLVRNVQKLAVTIQLQFCKATLPGIIAINCGMVEILKRTHLPELNSHTFSVLSSLPLTNNLESEDQATSDMPNLWPEMVFSNFPSSFHSTRTFLCQLTTDIELLLDVGALLDEELCNVFGPVGADGIAWGACTPGWPACTGPIGTILVNNCY
uniref:Uncharacterized protein n=1 Tax=Glossina pallidipes TaxID=7398 RepID=A0A1B0AC48_GLOPL